MLLSEKGHAKIPLYGVIVCLCSKQLHFGTPTTSLMYFMDWPCQTNCEYDLPSELVIWEFSVFPASETSLCTCQQNSQVNKTVK